MKKMNRLIAILFAAFLAVCQAQMPKPYYAKGKCCNKYKNGGCRGKKTDASRMFCDSYGTTGGLNGGMSNGDYCFYIAEGWCENARQSRGWGWGVAGGKPDGIGWGGRRLISGEEQAKEVALGLEN